jgi:hypothetical protein
MILEWTVLTRKHMTLFSSYMPDIDCRDTVLNWVSENDLDIDHLPLIYLNRRSFVLRGIFGNWPDFTEVDPVTRIGFVAYGLSAVSRVTKSARRDAEAIEHGRRTAGVGNVGIGRRRDPLGRVSAQRDLYLMLSGCMYVSPQRKDS